MNAAKRDVRNKQGMTFVSGRSMTTGARYAWWLAIVSMAFLPLSFAVGCGDDSGGGNNQGKDASVDASGTHDSGHNDDAQVQQDGGGGDGSVQDAGMHEWNPDDFAHVYEVGPGHEYADPNEVPWESLPTDSLVLIYWRSAPYRSKWVINTEGTQDAPVVVLGVPDSGRLPKISGQDATTRQELDYWNENRSVIKVGGSSLPDENRVPSYVYIQGLDISGARPPYSFTGHSGSVATYSENAAAVHVEIGDHITIEGCEIHDAGNGIFTGWTGSHIVIRANHIFDNGIEDSQYAHNNYTESLGILFEYNHFGPLRSGCRGTNLKDRSAGTVIRYNWIESGNRQLDLVESDHAELRQDPSYRTTFVYGNILVEPDEADNSQILHYGGDGGDTSIYRKGTLHFYNNTVISMRSGNTTLLALSTNDEHCDVRNNVVMATAGSGLLAIVDAKGTVELRRNWLQAGWVDTHNGTLEGTVQDLDNLTGTDPLFVDAANSDYRPASGSPCIDAAGPLADAAVQYPVTEEYVLHQNGKTRSDDGSLDIGAFGAQ